MPGVFVNYRRADSGGFAGRLTDALDRRFGRELVFRDIELSPGVMYEDEIERQIAKCAVQLVVIGPSWLEVTNDTGQRRLDDPNDLLCQEIAAALKRDILVIPVLVDGARMPESDELPASIRGLKKRQAHVLPDTYWDTAVAKLIESIEAVVGPVQAPMLATSSGRGSDDPTSGHSAAASRRSGLWSGTSWLVWLVGIGFAAVAVLVVMDMVRNPNGRDPDADAKIISVCAFGAVLCAGLPMWLNRRRSGSRP